MLYISITFTPNFGIINKTLSELGTGGFGSVIFNGGLMMTGALMMLFSTGLWELGKNNFKGMVGSMLYLSISLIIVILSFVNINIDPWHYYLSIALFTFIPLSIIIFSLYLLDMDLRSHAIIGFITGAVSIIIWIIGGPVNGLKELISLLSLTVWQMPLGYWMVKRKSQ
jgi:hypothetical membrane protein